MKDCPVQLQGQANLQVEFHESFSWQEIKFRKIQMAQALQPLWQKYEYILHRAAEI